MLARILVLGIGVWGLLVAAVYLYGKRDEARPVDAIVVMGAAQYNGRPSPVLQARLDHAVALYRQGYAHTMVMTGGIGVGDTVSEAVVSRRYAVERGIPPAVILTERGGLSSAESLGTVAALMARHNLDTALLVSDPFHMLRLRILAGLLDVEAYSSPTRTSPISGDPDNEWKYILRESLSIPFSVLTEAW